MRGIFFSFTFYLWFLLASSSNLPLTSTVSERRRPQSKCKVKTKKSCFFALTLKAQVQGIGLQLDFIDDFGTLSSNTTPVNTTPLECISHLLCSCSSQPSGVHGVMLREWAALSNSVCSGSHHWKCSANPLSNRNNGPCGLFSFHFPLFSTSFAIVSLSHLFFCALKLNTENWQPKADVTHG